MSVISLYNPLEEDFIFRWDSVPYTVKGKTATIFPAIMAKHGAKHLVDYILLRPQLWDKLGIIRQDKGDIRNSEGQIVNAPNWTKDREPVEKLVLGVEAPHPLQEQSKTEKEKVKEEIEKLNEKPFEDLNK